MARSLVGRGKALARTRRTRDWRHPRRSPCAPRAPRGVGTCLCRVSRHTGPPLGPLPAPRELQGPLAETAPRARPSLARTPSRARPGPFTPLACAIPGGEVSEKAGYTLLRECSPNVADRFGDLKRNDTAQNQPRRRLRGMNSHVPMASPQRRNKKTLNIVNRILQAAAALRVS